MLEHLASGPAFDLVLGTSVGALNGALFAMGQTSAMRAPDLWGDMDGIGGFLTLDPFKGAGKGGIYSTRPLRDRLRKYVTGKAAFKHPYGCGLTIRETGEHRVFMHSEDGDEDLRDAILGSCTIAGLMTPAFVTFGEADKKTVSDGGHIHPLPLPEDVAGDPYAGKVTEVVAVLCHPFDAEHTPKPTTHKLGAVDAIGWAAGMAIFQGHRWAVSRLRELAEDGVKVTVYAPPDPVGGLLDAKRATIAHRLKVGAAMAANPLVLSPS